MLEDQSLKAPCDSRSEDHWAVIIQAGERRFGTGMIVAEFSQYGMTAWARERLSILVKRRVSWWAHDLSTLPGTPS